MLRSVKTSFFLVLFILISNNIVLADTKNTKQGEAFFNLDSIRDIKEFSIDEKIINNKYMEKALEQAKNLVNDELNKKIIKEQARIRKEVFGQDKTIVQSDGKNKQDKKTDGDVYVFISKSVPIGTLRNYAKYIDKNNMTNARIVMRGFVGGMKKIMPTVEFIQSIIKEDKDCNLMDTSCKVLNVDIEIDPLLFRKYGIEKVPAVVVDKGSDDWKKVYGDLGLEGLVERVE